MPPDDKGDLKLLDYLDGLVENLRTLIPQAIKDGDVEAVHHARVCTRRLKAAVDLMGKKIDKPRLTPFAKATRKLRRSLGPLRDLDVMIEHLGEMDGGKTAAAVAWAQDRLGERRKTVAVEMRRRVPPQRMLGRLGSWWMVRRQIETHAGGLAELLSASVHAQLDAFAEQAGRLARGEGGGDAHQLRIDGKSLRYTLEMANRHGQKLPRPVFGLFKKIQTALGMWHDWAVLTDRVVAEAGECELALHQPKLYLQTLKLAEASLKRSQRQLDRVSEIWRDKGMELTGMIRQSFPLRVAVKPAKTDRDPDDLIEPAIVAPVPPVDPAPV